MNTKTCKISGCRNRHDSRGWCKKHYQNWLRYGDPIPPRKKAPARPYASAAEAVESETVGVGECLIWTGGLSGGHPYASVAGRQRPLARAVYGEGWAEVPEGLIVRHTCGEAKCLNLKHMQAVKRGKQWREDHNDHLYEKPWLGSWDSVDESAAPNPGYLPPEQ